MPPKTKEPTEGELVASRLSVHLAEQSKLLGALLGSSTSDYKPSQQPWLTKNESEDTPFNPTSQLRGVGAPVAEDDAEFAKLKGRVDPALETLKKQLLGKKAGQKPLNRQNIAVPGASLPASEQALGTKQQVRDAESSDDEDVGRTASLSRPKASVKTKKSRVPAKSNFAADDTEPEEDAPKAAPAPKPAPAQKKRNFLDEMLAEKAGRKKKKKNKSQSAE